MGIMPADRELKWQRVFRRFGLPGEVSDKDGKATEKPDNQRHGDDSARDIARGSKPTKK